MFRPATLPRLVMLLLLATFYVSTPASAWDADKFPGWKWREVGPYRGGRSAAATGIPTQPDVYYFGACGGGVWKTVDGGQSWKNVSDGSFGGSIGAVAVCAGDPNVVYVGGGEKTVRGNVSHGDGMWKSTDAGRTWSAIGLADSRHVSRIRVHPEDPDVVYVAAMGHLYGPNHQRGIYRSLDGGANWEHVLFLGEEVGAVDLAMDPTNARILYSTFWRLKRTPYSLESGGEGSSIWKSTDAGETWEEIGRNEGLPQGTTGISGITVSPSNPDNLYAIIEAEDGGVYRSRDAGKTWKRTNQKRSLRQRAWYYTRIYADPADENKVYVLNVQMHMSVDGGKTFSTISTPHGDNHDLWIDPADPKRMIEANDGGANVSYDGGKTWSRQDNQPTAQMYRVSVDNAFPYRLLGGQQDNSAVRIRSRSYSGRGIGTRDWEPTAGGESGHIVAKPDDPDIVVGGSYGGYLTVLNHRTGERRAVNVWPDNPMGWGAAELEYRFQWNFPIFFSPHDPDVLYVGGNVLFRSNDLGASWEAVSPDLTRNDKSKQASSGGAITQDNTSVEYYSTIFAAAESPFERGVLWVGTDDGLVQLSRDGGQTWDNVTPPQMPEWAQVNSIEVHPSNKGGLYIAATRYKSDDFRPYIFKTNDYGRTWETIASGIPEGQFTRVVRADPSRPGLLYAGTERGVFFSLDDGANWQALQMGLPIVPITDLAVKEGDLVAATQGRGYWVLDDLSVLHQWLSATPQSVALFAPRDTFRISMSRGRPGRQGLNPRGGVKFRYWLPEAPTEETAMELEIRDGAGNVVQTYTRKKKNAKKPEPGSESKEVGQKKRNQVLEAEAGLNTYAWGFDYPRAESFPGMVLWNRGGLSGPKALPGSYTAVLRVGEEERTVAFEIKADPRSGTSLADLRSQFEFVKGIQDKLTETHRALGKLRKIKGQLKKLEARLEDSAADLITETDPLVEKLEAIEKALYQTQNQSAQDPLNFPIRLNDKLAGVASLASRGDFPPTRQMVVVRDRLVAAIDEQLGQLSVIWETDLPKLNDAIRNEEVPAIGVPTKDD